MKSKLIIASVLATGLLGAGSMAFARSSSPVTPAKTMSVKTPPTKSVLNLSTPSTGTADTGPNVQQGQGSQSKTGPDNEVSTGSEASSEAASSKGDTGPNVQQGQGSQSPDGPGQ